MKYRTLTQRATNSTKYHNWTRIHQPIKQYYIAMMACWQTSCWYFACVSSQAMKPYPCDCWSHAADVEREIQSVVRSGELFKLKISCKFGIPIFPAYQCSDAWAMRNGYAIAGQSNSPTSAHCLRGCIHEENENWTDTTSSNSKFEFDSPKNLRNQIL